MVMMGWVSVGSGDEYQHSAVRHVHEQQQAGMSQNGQDTYTKNESEQMMWKLRAKQYLSLG